MESRCPGCGRTYDISDDFISMGGKAKCPHCMLELEDDGLGHTAGLDTGQPLGLGTTQPAELDGTCPSCARRYKVERKYLESGGKSRCPYCSKDLVFDFPGVASRGNQTGPLAAPASEESIQVAGAAIGKSGHARRADASGESDLWAGTTQLNLPELGLLHAAPPVEQPPPAKGLEEESQKLAPGAKGSGSLSSEAEFPGAPQEQSEVEIDLGLGDVEPEDEASTQIMDRQALLGLELESKGSALPAQEVPSGEASTHPPLEGLFSGLASSQDWANAATRWAESGFKVDSMPSFIRGEPEAQPGSAAAPSSAALEVDATLPSAEETVEVSEADIVMLDETDTESYQGGAPTGELAPSRPAGQELRARRVERPPRDQAKRVVAPPKAATHRKTGSLLLVLGFLVLVGAIGLWMFLGQTEDVQSVAFPKAGLKATVIPAPAPSVYQAKEKAVEHYGLGNRLAHQGKFKEAILEYKQALVWDPGFPHPHRAMGAIYAAMGKPSLSAAAYETYLKLAPQSADANQVRKIIQASLGH